MITFLSVLVVFGLVWLLAMQIQLHGLKGVTAEAKQIAHESAAETRQLAEEAVAEAKALLTRAHRKAGAPPAGK